MADEGRPEPSQVLLDRRRKLEELRAAGVEPFPHAFPGVQPIAAVKAPHEELAAGEETERRRAHRRPPRRPPRPGQGRVPRPRRPLGAHAAQARVNVLGDDAFARLLDLDLGDLIGVDGTVMQHPRAASSSLQLDGLRRCSPSRCARRPTSTTASPTSRPATATARSTCSPARRSREPFITRAKVIAAVRRFLDDAGFVEVETPVLQPIYGGAAGAAVRHPPQPARPRALPADRHRAVPQALHRRRARARLRARQGLPQRGRLLQAQPRVHDARVVRGLRGLRRRRAPLRGARGLRRRAGRLRGRARLRARRGAARRSASAIASRTRRRRPSRRASSPRCRPRCASRGSRSRRARRPGPRSSTTCSPSTSSRS